MKQCRFTLAVRVPLKLLQTMMIFIGFIVVGFILSDFRVYKVREREREREGRLEREERNIEKE